MKYSKKIYKIEYTLARSIKRYEVSLMVSINGESRLWKDTTLGARHTSSVVDITLDNWCNQSRRMIDDQRIRDERILTTHAKMKKEHSRKE